MGKAVIYGSAKSDKASTADAEKQFQAGKEYAEIHQKEVFDYRFDISSSDQTDQRPGLQAVLDMAAAGEVDTVIVSDLSKISPSIAEVAKWLDKAKKSGARVISRKGCGGDVFSPENQALAACMRRFLPHEEKQRR